MKNSKGVFKVRGYELLARIDKAMASPQQLELLDLLRQGPRTVENLAQEAHQTVAKTSRHLQVLCAVRLDDGVADWRAHRLPITVGEQIF